MLNPEIKVFEVPTGDLVPYANNAKLHSQLQVEQIANSIEEFGFNDPIAVWENPSGEMEVVEGHGRVLAAKKLGLDKVPVFYLNHLSDEQRRAYTHVHNQTTLNSGFDIELLDKEIEALDFDFEDFGFTPLGTFDAIEDLMYNDFAVNVVKSVGETFNITFTFPQDSRGDIESYIKAVGKQAIVDEIMEEASQWAE